MVRFGAQPSRVFPPACQVNLSWWAFSFLCSSPPGGISVIPSRLVLLLFRRSRLAIRSRVRVASLCRFAPLTAQAFAAPFRCDGGSGGNDNSIELANGVGMDAVLIARFSPGWTPSGCNCRLCGGAGVAGVLRVGRVWLQALRLESGLLFLVRTIFLCQALFCSYVPKELYLLQVRL